MATSASSGTITKAFCIGQAKSGTASVYGLLANHYRAAHEPERAQLLDMILQEARGDIDANSLLSYLVSRDQRLNLDYDIAWANQFIAGHLLTAFPEARFIALVRNPYTWLPSIIGHLISREIPPAVRSFLDFWFKPELYPHTRHDSALEAEGVYSIAAYLNAWRRHVDLFTNGIPRDRLLIIRTHELNDSRSELARFLRIPVDSLDTQKAHLNHGTWSGQLHEFVAKTYITDMISEICADHMPLYFPEVGETT